MDDLFHGVVVEPVTSSTDVKQEPPATPREDPEADVDMAAGVDSMQQLQQHQQQQAFLNPYQQMHQVRKRYMVL